MKKIAIISTASVLALGAVAIAADADGISHLAALNGFASSYSAQPVQVSQSAGSGNQTGVRHIRIVSPGVEIATSCSKANWPYYPPQCLQNTGSMDL
ncbi:MAG: hypothetical protein ABJN75_10750 [Hoeflea sp.]|uniref:hypothetical protein n=1 Tax=Hoeflea sp. TaxID=1940281 RepID=UPI00329A75AA